MSIVYLFLLQLLSYGVATWLLIIAAAFLAARVGGVRGVILGHILIAVAITALDLRWIQSEMHKPGWDGQPDQDPVFMIGVLLRILLINTVLLPVSFLGVLKRRTTALPDA